MMKRNRIAVGKKIKKSSLLFEGICSLLVFLGNVHFSAALLYIKDTEQNLKLSHEMFSKNFMLTVKSWVGMQTDKMT